MVLRSAEKKAATRCHIFCHVELQTNPSTFDFLLVAHVFYLVLPTCCCWILAFMYLFVIPLKQQATA